MTEKTDELERCADKLCEARDRALVMERLNVDEKEKTTHLLIQAVAHLVDYLHTRDADHPALTPVQLNANIEDLMSRVEALESAAEALLPSWATESPDSRLYGAEARPEPPRAYLGDSVYAHFDGFAIVLCLDNGRGPHSEIVLEPAVYAALIRFAERIRTDKRAEGTS